MFCEVDSRF